MFQVEGQVECLYHGETVQETASASEHVECVEL